MTPNSDEISPRSYQSKEDLLKTIGNPGTSEHEWLAACERLAEDHDEESRSKNVPVILGQCAIGAAVLTALVFGGVTVSSFLKGQSSVAPLPQAALETPVSPPASVPAAAPAGEPNYRPYMVDLQRHIKHAWYPPKGNESKRVVARFKMHSNGMIDSIKIWKSSGVPSCDRAALKAIENTNHFRPLPSGAPENVDIEFTFDYNVFHPRSPGDSFSSSS